MRILFFDTETNGLPVRRHAAPDDLANWPRVVQIAWQLVEVPEGDTESVLLSKQSFIVQPDPGVIWNEGSAAFHKISKATALSSGTPGPVVFEAFLKDAKEASLLVAHNLAFDTPVVVCELIHHGLSVRSLPEQRYCTMEGTKAVCKLPSQYGRPSDPYKYPKLAELYACLFGTADTPDFHAADVDVQCLVRCFLELVRRNAISLPALPA